MSKWITNVFPKANVITDGASIDNIKQLKKFVLLFILLNAVSLLAFIFGTSKGWVVLQKTQYTWQGVQDVMVIGMVPIHNWFELFLFGTSTEQSPIYSNTFIDYTFSFMALGIMYNLFSKAISLHIFHTNLSKYLKQLTVLFFLAFIVKTISSLLAIPYFNYLHYTNMKLSRLHLYNFNWAVFGGITGLFNYIYHKGKIIKQEADLTI